MATELELSDFSVPAMDDDLEDGSGSNAVITITMGDDPSVSGVLSEIASISETTSTFSSASPKDKVKQTRAGKSNSGEDHSLTSSLVAGVLVPGIAGAGVTKMAQDVVHAVTKDGLRHIRPWSEFFSSDKIGLPAPREMSSRVPANLRYYQSNYLFIFLSLALYSVITSPSLLFVALGMGALAIYLLYLRTDPIVIFGVSLSDHHRASIVLGMSLILCVFTSAASTLLWIASFAFVVVALHSSLWKPVEEDLFV